MNIAEPDLAFSCAQIPNDGVGLARLEFIINNIYCFTLHLRYRNKTKNFY